MLIVTKTGPAIERDDRAGIAQSAGKRAARLTLALLLLCFAGMGRALAQSPAPPPAASQAPPLPKATFAQAADEVLQQMSQILSLPVKEPLKKTLRSKEEIRAYLVKTDQEDKDDTQKYADDKSLEAFGLIPKDFPLDSFMLDVLTDQVAGLYDPKEKEFYIADWIAVEDQREVMSHELTHALEDQSFGIDPWIKAARPNDDAELARDAVSEGTAVAAMLDYALRDQHLGVRDLPDVSTLLDASAIGEMDKDAKLSKAPLVIRDSLLFPYLAGASFSQAFLKAHTGWPDLKLLFAHPPVSTQQIIHPDLYLKDVRPVEVKLPKWDGLAPKDWKLLEENAMGEFGVDEILKQFLDPQRAATYSPMWAGDRYAVFEDKKSNTLPLVFLLALDSNEDAARFFGQYSVALEMKYDKRTALYRRPNFFQFETPTGGVFLHCVDSECLVVESATRETFDAINHAVGWPAAPGLVKDSPSTAQIFAPAMQAER